MIKNQLKKINALGTTGKMESGDSVVISSATEVACKTWNKPELHYFGDLATQTTAGGDEPFDSGGGLGTGIPVS